MLRNSRISAAVVLCVVIWMAGTGVASAHSDLEMSDPADGSIVTEPVGAVTFVFTRPVEPFREGFTLTSLDGRALEIAAVEQPDAKTVVVNPIAPIIEPVAATWAIVSGDSHPVTGTILFAVDPPATTTTTVVAAATPAPVPIPPNPAPPPQSGEVGRPVAPDARDPGPEVDAQSLPREPLAAEEGLEQLRAAQRDAEQSQATADFLAGLVRWLGYAATAVALGGLALALLADRDHTLVWTHGRSAVWVSLAVLGAGSLLMIGTQLAVLTGDPADLVAIERWGDVLDGRFRAGVVARLVGAGVIAVAIIRSPRSRPVATATGSSLVLGSFLLLGHSSGEGSLWLTGPSTIVHLAAVSVWVGGLIVLLRMARRSPGSSVRRVARTFSRMAGAALAATIVAGLSLTAARIAAVDELWTTSFGQRLTAKLALVAVVVGLGAVHRFRTVPTIEASDGLRVNGFVRVAWLEVAGFAAVLGLTAWLVSGAA